MKRITASALLASAVLAGCEVAALPDVTLTVHEVISPAGEDSGEPFLSSAGDTVFMSWLGRSASGARQMSFARLVDAAWDEPSVVTQGERLLVNVADFPSIVPGQGGDLWAHWLERDAQGFGYGIRVSHSDDGGESWSEPWTLHEDGTPTEHGFVSAVPTDGGVGYVWLDGRAFATSVGDAPPTMETALFFRTAGGEGPMGPETLIDVRVCDCCQTDVAVTSGGPVVVYRDRSPEEIRDIRVTRFEHGTWSAGRLVHEDGWETGACPINGPAVAAKDDQVAVAWFTAADGRPRVHVAFSSDAAESFDDPTVVDDGSPAGRVDVVLLDDGSALVSWVERTGGDGAQVRVRRVDARGQRRETVSPSAPFSERVVGFPRLVRARNGAIILAWTDGAELVPRVRVTQIEVEES